MARYNKYQSYDDIPVQGVESGFKGFNNRLRPDQLIDGVLSDSANGRFDVGGEWQTRKGVSLVLAPFATPQFVFPFYTYANKSSSAVSRSGNVIQIDFGTDHAFTTSTLANVSGITGITPDPNGNRIITVVDANSISISVSELSGTAGGTAVVGAGKVNINELNEIFGAEPFYDDSASNESYIVIVGNSFAKAVNLETNTATTIAYPSDEFIFNEVGLKQFANKLYMFRDGLISMVWNGALTGTPAFTLVENGAYTQPISLSSTAFEITNGKGKVTVSTPSAGAGGHGLSVGDVVVLTDIGSSGLLRTFGNHPDSSFVVSEIGSTSIFYFVVNSENLDSISDTKWSAKISQSMGFSHMPAPPWATVHQNRLVCPYNYLITGSSGSATITDRDVRDELIFSRPFEPNIFDHIYGQFTFSPGKSDYIVATHSFSKDQLVVLNRESIYVVSNTTDIKTASLSLITPELGCVARQSVVQVGAQIIFLSDNGVYSLDFQDLYNLRGRDLPISESINATIARITPSYAKNAKAVYFDNRYYLAVPLDGSSTNNYLIIYNFLNKQWESIDSIDNPVWRYSRMLIAGDEDTRGVYTVNSSGGVHKIDGADVGVDSVITQMGGSQSNLPVQGSMTTKMIIAGTLDRKKWVSWELEVQSSEESPSNATLSAITENNDGIIDLQTIESRNGGDPLEAGQDISIRGRFGNPRSYGIQFKIDTTQGRPRVRTIRASGHKTFNSTSNAI